MFLSTCECKEEEEEKEEEDSLHLNCSPACTSSHNTSQVGQSFPCCSNPASKNKLLFFFNWYIFYLFKVE